jgi:transcriptional regulator with XRE-family HTH domain
MIGNRLRQTRVGQQRSLADVASKADISVATLSRIENNKQALDMDLFLRLSKILKVAAAELVAEEGDGEGDEPLARRVAGLAIAERTKLWRDMVAARKQNPPVTRRRHPDQLASHVEELLAQIEFLRSELEVVRKRVRREPVRRLRV